MSTSGSLAARAPLGVPANINGSNVDPPFRMHNGEPARHDPDVLAASQVCSIRVVSAPSTPAT